MSWFKHRQPRMPLPVPMPSRQAAAPQFASAAPAGHEDVAVPTMTQPPIPADERSGVVQAASGAWSADEPSETQYQDALDPVSAPCASPAYEQSENPACAATADGGAEEPLSQPIAMAVDRERRTVSLRMNYTAAIVSVFAIVVAIVLAVAVGRNLSRERSPVLTPTSTSGLRQQAAHPQVLDIHPGAPIAGDAHQAATLLSADHTTGSTHSTPAFNEPHPPSNFVNRDARRSVGLNYVIIQSYPSEKLASDAVAFLNKHEVPCTIERKLKNWPDSLYLVVGIDGFSRISSAEYKAYIAKIEKLSAQYASPRSFKAFEPTGKKWDKPE